jgi:hypothetical protein
MGLIRWYCVTLACMAAAGRRCDDLSRAGGGQPAGAAVTLRSAAAPPYDAAVGDEIVTTAEDLARGGSLWTRGCEKDAPTHCIPYSWGGGHDPLPGPSQRKCRDGWTPPKRAPGDLRDGPECYRNGNKNDAENGTYGLDCSGFTRLVYYLVYGTDVLGANGTRSSRAGRICGACPRLTASPATCSPIRGTSVSSSAIRVACRSSSMSRTPTTWRRVRPGRPSRTGSWPTRARTSWTGVPPRRHR